MFRTILCPSSGAQDCGLQQVVYCPQIVVGRRPGLQQHGLCVRCEGYCSSNIPYTEHSLAFLKTGKELPEICWAILKINKLLLLHLVGPLLYSFIILAVTNVKVRTEWKIICRPTLSMNQELFKNMLLYAYIQNRIQTSDQNIRWVTPNLPNS